jgi:NADH:ubiquinone oxidoreductase subunit F (NADH-binding)
MSIPLFYLYPCLSLISVSICRCFSKVLLLNKKQGEVPDLLQIEGGIQPGASREVSQKTGVPEAHVYGVGSFFNMLARPDKKVRVCTGLSCRMAGADQILQAMEDAGMPVEGCSCLAACDVPPAVLRDRDTLPAVSIADVENAKGDWTQIRSHVAPDSQNWHGHVGPEVDDPEHLSINLLGKPDYSAQAFQKAQTQTPEDIIKTLETSGLQGRGGAGFPAFFKWNAVRSQQDPVRYVVLNGDESEPGTFKDREILMRRPDLIIEGLAIAAHAVGAKDVYLYLRGEFAFPRYVKEQALKEFQKRNAFPDINFHFHEGQGAYICGEETALLEALEGKRGMPRLRPPYPTEYGLWGKPTLIHNVETVACIPSIIQRGGDWFRELGKTEAGPKVYCISGHVQKPGIYELPLGITLDELVEEAGGYIGNLKTFSPGGASSGFLPAKYRNVPLDFKNMKELGSLLGSAGVVVLNDTVNIKWAVSQQLRFFEDESCGQCAPCRIGTRYLHEAMEANIQNTEQNNKPHLRHTDDVAWQMREGSICGLGQIASLPLTSAQKFFPEEFNA